ncbi:MAG: heme exporter protein CcmD [SAR116 cluster bacterium]|nr:heme exporter protein CcmD [SAR116 cluster bacterium]
MYGVYIYTSYAFTFFALGGVIAVSVIGLARARQRLAALQDTQVGDA